MKFFVISLSPKRQASLDYDYKLFKGCEYEEVPVWIKKNFWLKYNEHEGTPNFDEEKNHWTSLKKNSKAKARMGCFAAHMKVLEYIAENEIDDVAILEDDAHIDRLQFPEEFDFPQDSPCLLSGVIHHPKCWQKDPQFIKEKLPDILESFDYGVNTIDYDKYRWSSTIAIYYPNHYVVKELLEKIKGEKHYKYTHLDIYYTKNRFIKYLYYPSLFTGNDAIDENRNPIKCKSQIGKGEGIIRNYKKLGKTFKIIRENTPPFMYKK